MIYTKRIPAHAEIIRLSTLVTSFPASRREVVRVARMWNMDNEVIEFVRLIPPDEIFDSRTDFVKRAESLAMLVRQEWESTSRVA